MFNATNVKKIEKKSNCNIDSRVYLYIYTYIYKQQIDSIEFLDSYHNYKHNSINNYQPKKNKIAKFIKKLTKKN